VETGCNALTKVSDGDDEVRQRALR
jgi:hypothetical protein